ncbi:MAG TPA: hypothetical protein VNY05_18230 [Candidatus Acidoferrales bacterium]|nr:hypothetical protein [Candidatus Acidoferrales bacterium]
MRLIQNTAGWLSIDSAPLDEDVALLVTDGPSEPYTSQQADRGRLGEFEQGNAVGGDAGEVEAVQSSATPTSPKRKMTPRRFPPPWRADKIPGGYVVRDANGQALVYLYSRDSEAEARQPRC